MKLLEIFKAGTHTDANGNTVTFTAADLQKSAAAYDPAKHEAPIVIGHPRLDDPAYGWIQSLSVSESKLNAVPCQLDPQFAELVQQGRFKKISASFYTPDSPANPTPGVFALRHVGFLGATPPAIKGLKAVEFGESEDGVIEFSDWLDRAQVAVFRNLREFMIDQFGMDVADKVIPLYLVDEMQLEATPVPDPAMFSEKPMDANYTPAKTTDYAEREAALNSRETELRAREIAIQRQEFLNFAEDLVKQGKLLPAQKGAAVELLAALSLQEPQVVEFGEGETAFKGDLKTLFERFLTAQPTVVEYGEVATGAKEAQPLTAEEIAQKATEYRDAQKAKGLTVSFAEAVSHVTH